MKHIHIRQNAHGGLYLTINKEQPVDVIPSRCFPWSKNNQYISLRNIQGEEVTLINNLRLLDSESRTAVESALSESAFVMEIEKITHIETEFEIRNWRVITRQGAYTFQTKLDEWPQKMNSYGLLIRDVAGNLFQIDNIASLDHASKQQIWPFID